ncbi:MAG: SMC-Scp complex subunit ScpB [Candidatus Pacearchaeota archaeon]
MDIFSQIEAILFIYGEPIEKEKLAKKLNIDILECQKKIQEFKEHLKNDPKRGLIIIENDDKIQLTTKPELNELIKQFIKEEYKENLTPVSLEVLTIIGYLGPISKITIDQIRGVNSAFILRNLLMRGLIERKNYKNTFLYYLSENTLKYLGISTIEELPNYQEYQKSLKQYLNSTNEIMTLELETKEKENI